MTVLLVFGLALVLTFAIVVLLTGQSKAEKAAKQQLERLDQVPGKEPALTEEGEDLLKPTALSDIPWLDLVLRRLKFASRLQRLLSQAESAWTVGRVVAGSLVLMVATAYVLSLWWTRGVLLPMAAGVAMGTLPYLYLHLKRSAKFRKFNSLLPEAIDLMSRALRAGHSITSAIEMVALEVAAPVGPEFRHVFEQQNFGLPFREAVLSLADRVPLPEVQFLVTAMLVQKETGGNLAEILDKTSTVLRERGRLQGQLRIYTAQGRLTAWVLGLMPFFVFVAINVLNPRFAKILLEDPTGRMLTIVGLVMMTIGVFVIRKIVDIKV